MPRFELKFTATLDTSGEGDYEEREDPRIRVIAADTGKDARRIGRAMLGEEVECNEWLQRLVSVKATKKAVRLIVWDEQRTWDRVINKLGLKPSEYLFLRSGRKKVGIRFRKSQMSRA